MIERNKNRMVKTLTDASMIIGLSAGLGYLGKKILKEPLTNDPSSSVVNYGKWVVVLSGSMALKDYLEAQKIIPENI